MKYLIDTYICIYIMNKRSAEVIKKFKQFSNALSHLIRIPPLRLEQILPRPFAIEMERVYARDSGRGF
jgi:hypothetical protein